MWHCGCADMWLDTHTLKAERGGDGGYLVRIRRRASGRYHLEADWSGGFLPCRCTTTYSVNYSILRQNGQRHGDTLCVLH